MNLIDVECQTGKKKKKGKKKLKKEQTLQPTKASQMIDLFNDTTNTRREQNEFGGGG